MRRLSDIVSKQHPLMLPGTASVTEACQLMSDNQMDSVLVVDAHNRLLGIFTDHDVAHRVIATGQGTQRTLLSHVMTSHPSTMPTHKTAIDALRLMWDCGFRHIPVLENDRVIGVACRGDFKRDELMQLEREREFWEDMR